MQGATVPVAYATAYDALLVRGRLQPHHRVLIHSATGAVGLAATRIALSRGCEVGTCLMHATLDACMTGWVGCHDFFYKALLPVNLKKEVRKNLFRRAAQVFVTCGTADKRAFLLAAFPGLREDHIGDSRSTSFEALVKRQTAGAGVHLALNSLADDKLQVPHLLAVGMRAWL